MKVPWYTVKKAAEIVASSFAPNMSKSEIADEIIRMAANGHIQLGVTGRDSEPLWTLTLKHPPKLNERAGERYWPAFQRYEPELPVVAIETLCVPHSELPHVSAIANGGTIPPRDLNEVVVSNHRPGLQFVSAEEVEDLLQQRSRKAETQARHDLVAGLSGQAMDQTDVLKSALFAAGVAFGHRISMQSGDEDPNRSDERTTPVRADPTRWPSRTPPVPLVDEKRLDDGEPFLMPGFNKRGEVEKWVEWAANRLMEEGDTSSDLAARIIALAERRQIQSERGQLTKGNVLKMLPAGITGKRGRRPGSQSKK